MGQLCFEVPATLPWSLAVGDIVANLEGLRVAPDATESTTWKIQQLVQGGAASILEVAERGEAHAASVVGHDFG